jgi:pimeloyl-ACP methyl ester carboxylesterase
MKSKKNMGGLKFVLLLSLVMISSCAARTPAIKSPNSIAVLEKVTLGGVEQWILIRGYDKSNPVLLFVHGGPGSAEMPIEHIFGGELEKHFVVVQWDQRGAGKSFHSNIPKGSMNVGQFVSDAHQLVEYLQKRFGVKKIYLIGHSWGSLLGILTVSKYPESFYAYIGMGQVVDMQQNEAISYQFVMDEAHKRKDQKAINDLEQIGPPPYKNIAGLGIQRKYLNKFGGVAYDPKNSQNMYKRVLQSPEYTFFDYFKYLYGTLYSIDNMWDEVLTYNLFKQVPRVEVPVYFFEGRHDYNTPWTLVEQYYKLLDAPKGKTLIWFDNSAHSPVFEETEKFNQAMVRVRDETYNK